MSLHGAVTSGVLVALDLRWLFAWEREEVEPGGLVTVRIERERGAAHALTAAALVVVPRRTRTPTV